MRGGPRHGPEAADRTTTGSVDRPSFGSALPAERLNAQKEWDEVVLHPKTRHQIREIERRLKDDSVVSDGRDTGRHAKAGYRVLFHGPATGKTLTAALLGESVGRPVVRIDLSQVVSQYIGETEKNLSKLFGEARDEGSILFFDEADALFGKRTAIRDAHDKYANQEVAYLLRAIETHPGLVILATDQRDTVDDALLRHFQASVHFLAPREGNR